MIKKLVFLLIVFLMVSCSKTGGIGEPCRDTDSESAKCEAKSVCNEQNICQECGGDNQPCCERYEVIDNKVVFQGFRCLGGSACLDSGLCQSCGSENQICCPDGTCSSIRLACTSENVCVACGNKEQPCCGSGCFEGVCAGDGFCRDEICDQDGNCTPCGLVDNPCCLGETCKKPSVCSLGGLCLASCGLLGEPACAEHPCAAWFSENEGTCTVPFASDPQTDASICGQWWGGESNNRTNAEWCYWYAAYYKMDSQLCENIAWEEMKNLCIQGENPDDYYERIKISPGGG